MDACRPGPCPPAERSKMSGIRVAITRKGEALEMLWPNNY